MERANAMKKIFFIIMVCVLPGCGRIIDWGKSNFYQGDNVAFSHEPIKKFIKSVTIYDQLQTLAHFDALWLSDAVRTTYSHMHVGRMGKDSEKYKAFLRRQLEENNHFISFYILTTHDIKLGAPESHWSLFLNINGVDYAPFELKEIELPYEYQQIFGSLWNRFKVPYILKFRLTDENEQSILDGDVKKLALYARCLQKEHIFTWDLVSKKEQQLAIEDSNAEKNMELSSVKRKKRMRGVA